MTVDSTLPGVGSSAVAFQAEPQARDTVGLLFGRFSVLPALLALPFLLTGFPLLLLGWFKPAPVIVLWALLAAVIVPIGWRRIPSVAGAPDFGTPSEGRVNRTPRWTLAAVAAIAVAFGIEQAVYHSQFIIVMLDPASYMQFASWISQHGSLPIPQQAEAFGGAPNITFASAAFYQVGRAIVPQFMAGLPMVLSVGFWAGGARLAVFWGPLLGAAAVFTFGGLTARLVGPRWAPAAALTLAVCQPEQFTSRSTYSETLAQILFLGALSLWIDTQRTDLGAADAGSWRTSWRANSRSATHVLAGITGLLLGITLLVRLDGPSDILLVVPYCGLLILNRRRQVLPLVAGMIVGLLYGTVDGLVLSRPYLRTNISSVEPMAAAFALVAAATAVAVWWLRRRGRPIPITGPRLVKAVTILPFVVLAAFVGRPYVERNWHALQDAPLSLHWVYWYTGGPIIALGVIGIAVLSRRCVRGQSPVWVLPLLVFAWAIAEFLLRPAITPHQPWASRRMVPAVLPGLILFSVWVAAWLGRRARVVRLVSVPRYLERFSRVLVIACCVLAIAVPPAVDSLGLAFKRTYDGEITSVDKICAAIPADSSVLIVDKTMMLQFGEAIRGMCGVPTAGATNDSRANLLADVRAIERAGRHPFVLASTTQGLEPLGNGQMKRIMKLETTIDNHIIFGTPQDTLPQRFAAYSWEPVK
ncbi:MAG TPA: hypothetical protein VIL16_09165 [Trebonia sp.]